MDEVRSNSSLIKSNSFSHLLDFNTEKKYQEPIWNRISKGINCNNEIPVEDRDPELQEKFKNEYS